MTFLELAQEIDTATQQAEQSALEVIKAKEVLNQILTIHEANEARLEDLKEQLGFMLNPRPDPGNRPPSNPNAAELKELYKAGQNLIRK